MNKTVLLFGGSPYVNNVKIDWLRLRQNRITTIGINISQGRPYDYVAVYDEVTRQKMNQLNIHERSILITPRFNNHTKGIYYYAKNCNFTHDYVLKYILERQPQVDKVVLIGAADFVSGGHYYDKSIDFKVVKQSKQDSIDFIENNVAKRLKLYKMNPNGILNIPIFKGNIYD